MDGTSDYINLAFQLSHDLLYEMNKDSVSEMIWDCFIIAGEISKNYIKPYIEADDIKEYFEYKNEGEHTKAELIQWNYKIVKMLRDYRDSQPRYFNGLIYWYTIFVFEFMEKRND